MKQGVVMVGQARVNVKGQSALSNKIGHSEIKYFHLRVV